MENTGTEREHSQQGLQATVCTQSQLAWIMLSQEFSGRAQNVNTGPSSLWMSLSYHCVTPALFPGFVLFCFAREYVCKPRKDREKNATPMGHGYTTIPSPSLSFQDIGHTHFVYFSNYQVWDEKCMVSHVGSSCLNQQGKEISNNSMFIILYYLMVIFKKS